MITKIIAICFTSGTVYFICPNNIKICFFIMRTKKIKSADKS